MLILSLQGSPFVMNKRQRTLRGAAMRKEAFQVRALRGLAAALLALAAPLTLAACAPTTYAGISLKPGAADPELESLASRAQAGDKHAQLELGIRYEEGRGVPRDLQRAAALYRSASSGAAQTQMAYVPGSGSGPGSWTILSGGARADGLAEASMRLFAISPDAAQRKIRATVTEAGVSEASVCKRLAKSLELLYGAPPSECAAYPFDVQPPGQSAFRAYDLVVSIPPDVAAEREYATNGVDPIVMTLIGLEAPAQGNLIYSLLPAPDGAVPVIMFFEPRK
jgi:TPR repeat protein